MEQLNAIIILLIVIKETAKQIHYNCNDYGQHLLADRVSDNLDDYIDRLKEAILGNDNKPLTSIEYLEMAIKLIPNMDNKNIFDKFKLLKDKLSDTLEIINNVSNIDKADDNLISEIADNLKNSKGIINLQLNEGKI